MRLKKKPLNRSLTSSVGCPHLHRSPILSVIIQPLLAEIPCSSLCTRINPTKTQAGDMGSKFHTLPPSNIHDTGESNWGFHQIHLTAPDTPARTFPKQETSAGSATCEEALIWACKDSLAAQLCRGGPALLHFLVAMPIQQEKGHTHILFSAKLPFAVSSFYSFIRNLVQLLEPQLEKALTDLI